MSADVLDELEELRRREFRRLLGISVVAHALFAAALAWVPGPSVPLPNVVTVDLTATLPSSRPASRPKPAPAPKAEPAPQPAPPPPPPPPPPKKVVLPEKPQPLPEKPPPPEPKPAPKPPPPRARPAPVDYEDALEQLRDELGEQAPAEPAPGAADESASDEAESSESAAGSADGERIPPELAAWMKRAEIHVRRSWVTPQEFIDRGLVTRLRVTLSSTGEVIGEPEVTRSSGDPYYDENVVRAILRASPLPPPPEPGDWPFVFSPRDVR